MKIGLDLTEKEISAALTDNTSIVRTIDMPIFFQKRDSNKIIMEKILSLIHEILNDEVDGIGISLPSTCDKKGRIVYDIQKIPYWKKIKIKDLLEKEFNVPVAVNNDINCFLLGEKHYGTNLYSNNILGICADKKVDAGLILNNKLLTSNQACFNNIKCLSEAHHEYIRLYKDSYSRTLEELQLLCCNSDFKETKASDHRVWSEIGSCVGRLISVLIVNYDIHSVVMGGKLADCLCKYIGHIDDCLLSLFPKKKLLGLLITRSKFKNPRPLGAVHCLKDIPVNIGA